MGQSSLVESSWTVRRAIPAARLLVVLVAPVLLLLALTAVLSLGSGSALAGDSGKLVPSGAAVLEPASVDARFQNGEFVVAVFSDGEWQEVGRLAYDQYPAEKSLNLDDLGVTGEVQVRVEHTGETAAHIDSALLDGQFPSGILGASEDTALALKKLASRDYDVIDARGEALILTFDTQTAPATFSLTARIEPEHIPTDPFLFPLENMYQTMSASSAFYTYVWNSRPGALTVDGDLAGETLGEPFFVEFTEPGTGHPAGFTYGWVRNDDAYLYVAIDFTSDNTMDGDKDYAKVYVNTPDGLQEFKVSAPEQTWGAPGFVYTERVIYQHKVYEFAIPVSEIGPAALAGGELELAFAAYGTSAPAPPLYPGPLDPSFDSDGVVTTTIGGWSSAEAVAVQPDGKVVVVGRADSEFTLARYHSDGSLDTTFGTDGVVTTSIGAGVSIVEDAALQSDGKMVVVGYSRDESFTQFFTLARYDTSGNLDTAFGTGGVVTTSIGTSDGYANAVAIQDDGKIVVAGYAQGGSSDWVFTLARYDTSGNLDATFGIDGVVMTSVGADSDYGQDVAIQSDGKIVVAGWSWDSSNTVFSLARYTETGVLDAGFGVGGTVTQTVGTHAEGRAVAFQPDGKIVVAGYSYAGFGESNYDFTLLRYDDSGSLDGSFGSSGVVTTAFGNDADDRIYDIAIRENGAIVAVGANEPDYYLAVVQYTPDGAPLLGFGSVGRVNTDLGDHAAGAAVCLQPDGRIVVAGVGDDGPNTTFAVVRYGRDLAIHKTVTPPTAAPGEAITFTIAFSNTGALAPNVVIIDQMPLSVTVTGVVSAGVPITIVNAGPAVYAGAVGDLDYGQGGVITITGVVNTDSVADSFTNTVRINTNRWDSDPRNNSSAVTVSPLQVWLPLILKD